MHDITHQVSINEVGEENNGRAVEVVVGDIHCLKPSTNIRSYQGLVKVYIYPGKQVDFFLIKKKKRKETLVDTRAF